MTVSITFRNFEQAFFLRNLPNVKVRFLASGSGVGSLDLANCKV